MQPDFLPSTPTLTRWEAGTLPLFHRNMGLHWHDMCAESLGMPKVALLFLSRGPIHQVKPHTWHCIVEAECGPRNGTALQWVAP